MLDLGTVRPGTTLYIPFTTYDGGTGASITATGLAVTDIEVYSDGSVTQRASDAGYALLDTDGLDFDTADLGVGLHGFSIDLADNTTADFWNAGSQYWVVVSTITVDAQTVTFLAATFRIGYPGALLDTVIATLASQTSFTLETGPADNDALNGCLVVIHDIASAVQWGIGLVEDYTGATKTVTLAAGVSFTAAAGDNISVLPPALQATTRGRALDVSAAGVAGVDWGNVENPTATNALTGTTVDLVANAVDATAIATDAITADKIAADAIGASELATTAAEEIRDAILSDSTAFAGANIDAAISSRNALAPVRPLASGTAQAGTASTIQLASAETFADDELNGNVVQIISGTGAGQARVISDYTGSTDTATVIPDWTTNPSSDSVYEVIPASVNVSTWRNAQPSALSAGLVVVTVSFMGANVVTASSLATDAVNEIRDSIISDATTFPGASITEARLAELDAGNLPTDIANVQSDTDDIQTRLPAALVSGRMDSNVSAINDVNASAVNLERSASVFLRGTVDTTAFTPTTTEFEADDITEATADHYNGRIIIFTSGILLNQATDITDYVLTGGRGHFTVTALTEAPGNNDTFVMV